MEITQVAPGTIRIKGKQATLFVDPSPLLKGKTQAEALLLTTTAQEYDSAKIENLRLVVEGPGEYEISGVKITGIALGGGVAYVVRVDNVEVFCVRASNLEKNIDVTLAKPVFVVHADKTLSDVAGIADNNPAVVISYGEHAADIAKALGKEGIAAGAKFQTTQDKLPAELEVIILE